jgi:L-glyceraldehyde 3-phosphate reductase
VTEERLAQVRDLLKIAEERGQSLAQMALSWVLRHPVMSSALIGASHVKQIEQSVAAAPRADFAGEELARIEAVLTGRP